MESSTENSEDSLFGLYDIKLLIHKRTDQRRLLGSVFYTPGDHDSSLGALQSYLDDGNTILYALVFYNKFPIRVSTKIYIYIYISTK